MRTDDLVDRPIPITIGDRTFFLPRIKVATVLSLLRCFAEELREFRDSGATDVDGLLAKLDDPEATRNLVVNLLEPFDPAYVTPRLTQALAGQVLVQVASLNDLRRIWGSLSFKKPQEASSQETTVQEDKLKAIPNLLATIDVIARRYSISPREVVEWPYEMFLSIKEMVEIAMELAEKDALRRVLAAKGYAPELADVPGMEYSPLHGVH